MEWKKILEWKSFLSRDKKRKPENFVVIILIGILFLILSIPTEKKAEKEENREGMSNDVEQKPQMEGEYLERAEQELTEILESMEGVGKVKVMITLRDDGLTIVDKNKKETKEEKEEETVLYDTDDDTAPYVTSRQTPQIEGVLVVAQGGGNAEVNSDISDAIMALFDVEVHKIKIVKMSE